MSISSAIFLLFSSILAHFLIGLYDKMLIDWVMAGRMRNIWLLIITASPQAKYFSVRPSHLVKKYMTLQAYHYHDCYLLTDPTVSWSFFNDGCCSFDSVWLNCGSCLLVECKTVVDADVFDWEGFLIACDRKEIIYLIFGSKYTSKDSVTNLLVIHQLYTSCYFLPKDVLARLGVDS